jgi:hypothetical protein
MSAVPQSSPPVPSPFGIVSTGDRVCQQMATTDSLRIFRQATNRVDLAVAVCSALFIASLGMVAYWNASIRPLFWSLPCVAASMLSARRSKFEYALGVELFGRERPDGWCARRSKFGYALGVASGGVVGLIARDWSLTFLFARNGIPVTAALAHLLSAAATAGRCSSRSLVMPAFPANRGAMPACLLRPSYL